jgi:ornithine cyclodeaminase/alanine dehydrogenase-like protein (mu-crystallin family)
MGSDGPDKQELFPDVLARADRLVCDRKAQCAVRGELHHALAKGLLTEDSPIIELGDLTSGRKPGRQKASEITVCDLTGVGVQDTAIALLAHQKAQELGLGFTMEV